MKIYIQLPKPMLSFPDFSSCTLKFKGEGEGEGKKKKDTVKFFTHCFSTVWKILCQ